MKARNYFFKNQFWVLFLLAGGLLFARCSKGDKGDPGPDWFSNNVEYIYDLDSAGSVRPEYCKVRTSIDAQGEINLEQSLQDNGYLGVYSKLIDLPDLVKRKPEGLFITYNATCSFVPDLKDYLKVPTKPVVGQLIPLYSCGGYHGCDDTVVTVNENITVPAGTFQVFSIVHSNGDRSWWNFEMGIIQYQFLLRYTGNKMTTVTLKLRKIRSL